jgi:hypothetical protein
MELDLGLGIVRKLDENTGFGVDGLYICTRLNAPLTTGHYAELLRELP